MPSIAPDEFFSCDWGTTSFRLRRVNTKTGNIRDEFKEPAGIRALQARCKSGTAAEREKVFSRFFLDKLKPMLRGLSGRGVSVIISGMASSSVGWREVPYAAAPFPLSGEKIALETIHLRLSGGLLARIALIGGVRTASDMMRGEETELLGLFARGKNSEIARNGLVILPGTHSKHLRIVRGQLVGIQTFMTGEMFDVLANHSLLRASVGGEESPISRIDFDAGVRKAMREGLAASLFQVRTRTVLGNADSRKNRWFLSGLLIGAEVASLREMPATVPILLAAPAATSGAYKRAFKIVGRSVQLVPPQVVKQASIAGQGVVHERIWGSEI